MLAVTSITPDNTHLIEAFLADAGDALKGFRYYNRRDVAVSAGHLVTFVVLYNHQPVAYGHLDEEDGTVWLGVAVVERLYGKGLGKLMMQLLFTEARLQGIPTIQLAVDNDNAVAIAMYEKLGFETLKIGENNRFLALNL